MTTRFPMTIFDAATGAILRNEDVVAGTEHTACFEGEDWIAGYADPAAQRIDLETLLPAAKHTYNITITTGTISGIPPGTTVFCPETSTHEVCNDGEFGIDVDLGQPQVFDVFLFNPLYLDLSGPVSLPCE